MYPIDLTKQSSIINLFLGACIWVGCGCKSLHTAKYEIYPIAFIIGAVGPSMITNSQGIIASLIANNLGRYINTSNIIIINMITPPIIPYYIRIVKLTSQYK